MSDENWSRVAHLYAKIANPSDPNSPNGRANAQILSFLSSPPPLSSSPSSNPALSPIPLSQASYVLDMGCGSGAFTSAFLADRNVTATLPVSARLVAADVATTFVTMMQQRREAGIAATTDAANALWKRLEVQQWDARKLSDIPGDQVSHLLSTYAYFTMAGEREALGEALRVLRPGGWFVETSMGDTEWGFLPQLLKQVRPEKTIPGPGEHWWTAAGTEGLLREVGFRAVGAKEFEISLPMASAEEAVEFVGEVFPFMKGLMADLSEEEVVRMRTIMVEWVRERYPTEPSRMKGTAVMGWSLE